jgi:hypothetical protein
MGTLSLTLCDANLNPLPGIGGPILTGIRGRVVMTELDQFSSHTLEIGADDRRALLAIAPFTIARLDEDGLGTVAYGIIHDPEQQIREEGSRIILSLPNITDQLTQYSVGLGAAYEMAIGDAVYTIGATPPTGETITISNTTTGHPIAYVTFAGTTLACADPTGVQRAFFPGAPVSSAPLYDGKATATQPYGATVGYVATTTTGISVYDASSVLLGAYVPTNDATGWSAHALNDGPHAQSAAPVAWQTPNGNVTALGNGLRKRRRG